MKTPGVSPQTAAKRPPPRGRSRGLTGQKIPDSKKTWNSLERGVGPPPAPPTLQGPEARGVSLNKKLGGKSWSLLISTIERAGEKFSSVLWHQYPPALRTRPPGFGSTGGPGLWEPAYGSGPMCSLRGCPRTEHQVPKKLGPPRGPTQYPPGRSPVAGEGAGSAKLEGGENGVSGAGCQENKSRGAAQIRFFAYGPPKRICPYSSVFMVERVLPIIN